MLPDLPTLPVILDHTPLWVWLLLAYLAYQGLLALKDGTIPLWRSLLTPVAFIVWGVANLTGRGGGPMPDLAWVVAALALAPLGLLAGSSRLRIETTAAGTVLHRRGSPVPLLRNLTLFGLQFLLSVALASHPPHGLAPLLAKAALSGAMAGYFFGWTAAVLLRLRSLSAPVV